MSTITCANCGSAVDADEERCPSCSVPLQVTCPNCGTHTSGEDDTCPACGTLLAHAGESG